MRTLVHVTHEAVQQYGGIGAVLQGLLTSGPYRAVDQRTILIGPVSAEQLANGERHKLPIDVCYSSIERIAHHPNSAVLDRICHDFKVHIVYGHREFVDPHSGVRVNPEVVLIDVSATNLDRVNAFKARLWREFQIDSRPYEHIWDYELFVRLAEPARAVLNALGTADFGNECVVFAHEFMGLPTALAVKMDPKGTYRTVFHAHEVSTIRQIVEQHPGHDLTFYNLLSKALGRGLSIEEFFGPRDDYYRHALVKNSWHCDRILAVGDYVLQELRFLGPSFAGAPIEVTYNGIPSEKISLERKLASRRLLQDYAENLLGYRPDHIFTHVTRMAISKGLWRDLQVLGHIEEEFRRTGKTGVFFVLSTEIGPRRAADIREMERWWKWPVAHREVAPDLSGGEALFYQGVQEFNARARQIKIVYVNQFGWSRQACGQRMPENMELMDIHRGSDVEFGQSIYEPFGIAPLEALTFGGICVVSSACGCVGFIRKAVGEKEVPNILVADYTQLDKGRWTEKKLLAMDRTQRELMEARIAEQVARQLLTRLPVDESAMKALLAAGYDLSRQMSWDVVAGQYLIPAIDALSRKQDVAEAGAA